MNEQPRTFEMALIPNPEDADENRWQEECRKLASFLRSELGHDTLVDPTQVLSGTIPGETSRSGEAVTFSALVLTVLSSEALPGIATKVWETVNGFLSRRRGCRAVIIRNGNRYEFENLTREELLDLMR